MKPFHLTRLSINPDGNVAKERWRIQPLKPKKGTKTSKSSLRSQG